MHITLLSAFVSIFAINFLFINPFLFFVFILIHFLLDKYDGFYARYTKQVTGLGALLDKYSDTFLSVALLYKTYAVYLSELPLIIISLYVFDTIFSSLSGLNRKHKAPRVFVFFFLFGYYDVGLMVHLIYHPISITVDYIRSNMHPELLE